MVEPDPRNSGNRNRKNRKITPANAEPKREKSNRGTEGCGHRNNSDKSEPRRDAEASEQHRGDIAAETGIDRMTKRKLPGKAHHDIPGLTGKSKVEHNDQNGQ